MIIRDCWQCLTRGEWIALPSILTTPPLTLYQCRYCGWITTEIDKVSEQPDRREGTASGGTGGEHA